MNFMMESWDQLVGVPPTYETEVSQVAFEVNIPGSICSYPPQWRVWVTLIFI